MKEDFLHYIWKHKLFNVVGLKTTKNQLIEVNNVGRQNVNTGADFFNGQLRIDNQLWAGNIEIHVKSSDWYVHGHETDKNYDNVILHVVWEHDAQVFRKDNSEIPTLELSTYIDKDLLKNYKNLFSKQQKWINCEKDIYKVDHFLFNNWIERLYFERLEQKSELILDLLKASNNDWEAVLFKLLAKNFGLKVNGEAFLNLANSFDFSILRKESGSVEKLEALLFGQAGLLLEDKQDVYYQKLQKEYDYLAKKHNLKTPQTLCVQFFRLRPNNFPTIRLAQLASLYAMHQHLFSKLNELKTIKDFYEVFNIKTSSYWYTHYNFDSLFKKSIKKLTKPFVDLLLINTIIPLRFVYQKYTGTLHEDEILQFITAIKPEKNSIIEKFKELKIDTSSALKTQSLLELKNNYCDKQGCLQCAVGTFLLKKSC